MATFCYLVGDGIDPTNLKAVIWAKATRCQLRPNEFFFDEYPNIGLVPDVSHGAQSGPHRFKTV